MFTNDDLNNFFTYHPPRGDQVQRYGELRNAARTFAEVIIRCVPEGADQSAAIRKVREAVMTSNAGIACSGEDGSIDAAAKLEGKEEGREHNHGARLPEAADVAASLRADVLEDDDSKVPW